MFFAKLLKMKDVKLYRRHKIKIRISEKNLKFNTRQKNIYWKKDI